jgi:propionyl-CoA synthetase
MINAFSVECAVFGAEDDLKGQVPVGFVVLQAGIERNPEELMAELAQMFHSELGPVACFKQTAVVKEIGKR